jgi:HlyD family secretion protein
MATATTSRPGQTAPAAPPPRRVPPAQPPPTPWWVQWRVSLVAAGSVAIVLVIALGWHHHAVAATSTGDAADVVRVQRGLVERTVDSAGKVVANLDVDIKCRASGEVRALPFDISQHVGKGQLLCQLDPTDENLAVRSAEAQVAQTTAKLEQAKQNLETARLNLETTRDREQATLASARVKAANLSAKADRQRELIAQQLGSREEYETAQTDAAAAASDLRAAEVAIEELKQQAIQLDYKRQDVKSAEAQLNADQITLDTQRQQLAYTTVTAPIDGTVSALDVQLGSIVASGTGGFSGGTTIMTLSDLSRIFCTATVDESDIGGVAVGQDARVVVDSYPGRTFAGRVVRIATTGVSSSNVVTFEVKVEVLDEHKALLKPQMTGTVSIVEDHRDGVLHVPAAAVTREAGKAYVTLANGGGRRAVTLGLEGSDEVEVTSGLSAGDAVVLGTEELPTKWKGSSRGPPPG